MEISNSDDERENSEMSSSANLSEEDKKGTGRAQEISKATRIRKTKKK